MIRINLLPVRAARRRNTSIYQLVLMAVVVALTLLGVMLYNAQLQERDDVLVAEIDKSNVEIKRLRKIIGEVKELEKQNERLKKQLAVIKKLERAKLGPVRVLDDLANLVPKRVWITQFGERDGNLLIDGIGLENSDISEFLKALQKSKYFEGVTLSYTESQQRQGVTVFRFNITCKVNYSA